MVCMFMSTRLNSSTIKRLNKNSSLITTLLHQIFFIMKLNFFKYITLVALVLFSSSCRKEYLNPSTASEQSVVKDLNGILALCNGLQYRYSVGRQAPMYTVIVANGLTTREMRVLNAGNTEEDALGQGADRVLANNSVVTNLWEQNNLVKANAELILRNASSIGDAPTRNNVIAYASIFKALALGNMAQFWEQVTITVQEDATFSPNTDALREAIRVLEEAARSMSSTNNVINANFAARVAPGIDVANSVNALLARYYLQLGENDKALEAAGKVDLTKRSEFRFDDVSRNPIFDVALSNVNVVQPVDTLLGLPAALRPASNDGRTLFYLQSKTPTAGVWRGKGFFTANTAVIPVYLPGEMMLIRAEAFARKNQLTEAVTELNRVLTKTTDAFGIGAAQSAYRGDNTQAAILTEIYRNRCIELFMSGLKLADSRRFGREASPTNITERSRNYYPYPNNERDNNPRTPQNPAF
jgi:starch-binding outer membrane protein, SusD/RagB family